MKLPILIIVAASLILSGCVTAGQRAALAEGQITKKFCDTFTPITYDGQRDTALTKEQVREYNAKIKALCADL